MLDQEFDVFSSRAMFLVEGQSVINDIVGLRSLSIQEGFNVDEYRIASSFRSDESVPLVILPLG